MPRVRTRAEPPVDKAPTVPTAVVIVPDPVRTETNGQVADPRPDRPLRAERPLRANRIGRPLSLPESARMLIPIGGETGEFPALPRSLRD